MDTRANYTLVGAFVVGFFVLIIAAVMWLSDLSVQDHSNFYTVYFKEHTLDGLQVDSWVTMRGIRIGTVHNFKIAPNNIELVRVTLKLNDDIPVKTDTQASIKRNILTGLAWIDLIKTTADAPLLVDVPRGEDYPVLLEGRSSFEKIAANAPELMDQVSTLVRNAQSFLSEENKNSVTKTLHHIEQVTESLAKNRASLELTLTKLSELGTEGTELARSLRKLSDSARGGTGELANDVSTTVRRLAEVVEDVDKEMKLAMKSLRNVGEVVSQESIVVAQDFRRLSRALAGTLQEYRDPRSIIAGPTADSLGPGEKKR